MTLPYNCNRAMIDRFRAAQGREPFMPIHSKLNSIEIALLTIVGAACVHVAINHQTSIEVVSSWKATVESRIAATTLANKTDAAVALAQSQALPKIHLAS
jgi:hypothetical protein